MKKETYCLYEVIGYERYDAEGDRFINANIIQVIAENEEGAKKRAAELLEKPLYKVKSVVEYLIPTK